MAVLGLVWRSVVGGVCLMVLVSTAFSDDRGVSQWAWLGQDGRLAYQSTAQGDRIPDFSFAGYRGGGMALPNVAVVYTLEPAIGDDTQRLQEAIDEVALRPLDEAGFRGAILLKSGDYEISQQVNIRDSGIVLRGEGQGEGGTTLQITGRSSSFWSRAIQVAGQGSIQQIENTRTPVIDAFVPAGTHNLTVANATVFAPGDQVIVEVRKNAQWVHDLGMDALPAAASGNEITQWEAEDFVYRYERTVIQVEQNTLTLDAPLADAIDSAYGPVTVARFEATGRIENIGIENLRAIASIDGDRNEDGEHFRIMIWMGYVKNAWVRDVTSYHFGFGQVALRKNSTSITVQDCRALNPAASIAGSRRYAFYLSGQLALVQRCFANESRHPFGYDAYAAGPNVFLDCQGQDTLNDSGPHHRWATAGLLDNIRIPNDTIRIQNRLIMGGGHGWAGAYFVIWNAQASSLTLHSPPIAHNWAIGSVGTKRPPVYANPETFRLYTVSDLVDDQGQVNYLPAWGFDDEGDRHWDSPGQPVWPVSLYLQQLQDRLGPQAIENISDHPYSFASELQ